MEAEGYFESIRFKMMLELDEDNLTYDGYPTLVNGASAEIEKEYNAYIAELREADRLGVCLPK